MNRARALGALTCVLAVIGSVAAESAFAHMSSVRMCSPKQAAKAELACGRRAYYHGRGEVQWLRSHLFTTRPLLIRTLLAEQPQEVGQLRALTDHLWLMKQGQKWMAQARKRLVPPVPPMPSECSGASRAACDWYFDGATQCEVAHEGGFTTDSNPTYKGRFQMDYSFETETPYGRWAEETYHGRANLWPPGVQIQHAFEVWSYSGWSRWPPYYDYGCAAYHGGRYIA